MRGIAEQLIAQESPQAHAAGLPAAFSVCEKLRPHLSPLMGTIGFHALLSRALTLAQIDAPRLRGLRVDADGALTHPDHPGDSLDSEGGGAIIAHLLRLLEAFIGERLTLRMLLTVWPNLPLRD